MRGGGGLEGAHIISSQPNSFDGIRHQTHACSFQFLDNGHVALHIYKRNRQQSPILLKPADKTFLALGNHQEPLGANWRNGSHSPLKFFFDYQFEFSACLWDTGLGNDVDDGEDVDTPYLGKPFAADYGCADNDEVLPLVCLFGDFEAHRFDAHYYFAVIQLATGLGGMGIW